MVVRFDLFERLNTGGVELTDQEIRSCIYRGPFNDFLEKMAKDRNFKAVVRLPHGKEKDGTREELVLRFFAFFHKYEQLDHSVVNFLNDYMKVASYSFDQIKGEKLFTSTFAALSKTLPNGISRGRTITPVNLYEAVSVGCALALRKNGKIKSVGNNAWIKSEELKAMTTGATNNRKQVKGRIEYCATRFGW